MGNVLAEDMCHMPKEGNPGQLLGVIPLQPGAAEQVKRPKDCGKAQRRTCNPLHAPYKRANTYAAAGAACGPLDTLADLPCSFACWEFSSGSFFRARAYTRCQA